MLKILRNKKTAKKVWIGLAIIIVPAFTFWGFSGALRSRGENSVAGKIFGRNVTFVQLRDAVAAEKIITRMQIGDKLDELQQYIDFESQAWQRLALLAEARKRHIRASDNEVIEDIESAPIFQSKGVFNNKIYNNVLRYYLRVQPRVFEELIRNNIILARLYEQVIGKVAITDEEIDKAYARQNQEISVYYAAALPADFAKKISPAEQEISDYYRNNKGAFKEPVELSSKKTEARIPELSEIKDKVKMAFIEDAARKLAEEKIKECQAKLGNEELVAAGRKTGLKTGSTPLFKYDGFIDGIGPAQEFWNTAYALKESRDSGIISLPDGFYIIKVKSKTPIDEKRFSQEKSGLAKKLLHEKQQNYFIDFVRELIKKGVRIN